MKKFIAGAALIATLVGSATPALANTGSETQNTTVQTTATTETNTNTSSETNTTTSTETTSSTEATTTTEAATETEVTTALPDVSLTPDQLFYFLKLWVEQVQLALTRDAAARATLLEEQAQTRLAEAVKMAEEGKADLARQAMLEAQAKLEAAGAQIDVAVKGNKELDSLVKKIEADQVKFAKAVGDMIAKLPDEVKEELEPLTADLLVQVAAAQDAATQDETAAEEAEQVADEAGLKEELARLQPRQVLVLKAMAEASGKDLAEVYAMYEQNPGLGRIAKQLGLKMGPIQHAAQIEWMKVKAGLKVEAETEDEAETETEDEAETEDEDEAETEEAAEQEDDDEDEQKSKRAQKAKKGGKGQEKGARGLERAGKVLEKVKGNGSDKR